ncbi:M24 family metallopeptidase [Roseibium algae]|uniref:Xaa-Pro peptidase family protein n=1 Tax=Roseibium algae TaxID=3123038 RepID=A0ABU8TNQ6_9HYPH
MPPLYSMTQAADFPIEEYEARLERLHKAMKSAKMDAILLTTEAEVRYFTGFRTLFWLSPTRPWFLVIPANAAPIAIIPEIGTHVMASTWVSDIRTFSSPHENDDGVSLLVDVLKDKPRIGLLMGRETTLRMPLNDFMVLKDSLPASEWTDATAAVQSLRMIKSEREIALLSQICSIASGSFERAASFLHRGQTLKEVFRAFKIDLLASGADDVPYLVGGAGPGGYNDVISPPSDRPLTDGNVLMLDTGATLNGYFCDFDRNYTVGPASDATHKAYATLHRAIDAALDMARPGVTCADLFMVMANAIGGSKSDVGRFGHGLGMQLTEAPSLIDFDRTILKEGMVLTLEPSMAISDGKIMVHEENIVIRDGSPELLTRRAPTEIPILV